MPSRLALFRHVRMPAVALLVAFAAACETSDGLTTVPVTPPVDPADSIARVQWIIATPSAFAADTLRLVVRGPESLRQGRLYLRDPDSKRALYAGPVRGLRGTRDTVVLAMRDTELESGQRFEVYGEIRTTAGVFYYTTDADSGISNLPEKVAGPTSRFYQGRGLTLGGQTIGGMVTDPVRGWLAVTLSDRNQLVVLDAGTQRLLPWTATTGAVPGRVLYHPSAWGPGGTAVVLNTGGSDLSVIDLDASRASERRRIALPSVIARFGGDSVTLAPRSLRAAIVCAAAPCTLPDVLVSVGEPTGRAALLTVQPATGAVRGAVLPVFNGNALDAPIRASVSAQLIPGSYTTLATSDLGSRCSADRLGSAWFGQSQRGSAPQPLVLVTPDLPSACVGAGRVQRWDPVGAEWRPSTAVSLLSGGQAALPTGGLTDVLVADDASVVAVVAGSRVLLFRGTGEHIGTLPLEGEPKIAFLHDELGRPITLAIATSTAVQFYDPARLVRQSSIVPPPGLTQSVQLVPTGGQTFLLVLGGQQPARLWMLPLNLSSLGTLPTIRSPSPEN